MTKIVPRAVLIATAPVKTGLKSLFKQAGIFSASFVALILISSPLWAADAAHGAAGFDILGMKLGMSVPEIEAAIKAYDPAREISRVKNQIDGRLGGGKFIQHVMAPRQNPGKFPEGITVGFTVTEPSKAFYIGRDTTFLAGEQPLRANMVQQLREKYGPESVFLATKAIPRTSVGFSIRLATG
jgi:hypothetical protein